jgi:hypothetical protein
MLNVIGTLLISMPLVLLVVYALTSSSQERLVWGYIHMLPSNWSLEDPSSNGSS